MTTGGLSWNKKNQQMNDFGEAKAFNDLFGRRASVS
jgi:hypothetical protein